LEEFATKIILQIEKKKPVNWDSMTTIVFIFEKFSHPGDKEKKANKYKGFWKTTPYQ
jgi:hypothetical protein